jgi:hypothetical protein
LEEIAREYVNGLKRHETILGQRYVISTGDVAGNDETKMGFLQFIKKRLDEG